MTIEQALNYIHSVSWKGSIPGLSRTTELLSKMGNPHKKLKFVHVAGTNGKGSTCACIASILQEAGYKTGLYTSPFINVFNERMKINGCMISDNELAALVDKVKPIAESMKDHPTEFELITALAMQYFYQNKCDIVVLEVGMGGELDSTNVIEAPEVAVITALGLDHTRELGPTLSDIARAKAGIIKQGCTVVNYGGNRESDTVIESISKERNATLTQINTSDVTIKHKSLEGCEFSYKNYELFIPLVGTYQPMNASLAVEAVLALRHKGWTITDAAIVFGIAKVEWQGRFEILGKNPIFILDGSHNPHGMYATYRSLVEYFPDKKIVFLVGVMADKDVSGIFSIIAPISKGFITLRPSNPRAMDATALAEKLKTEFNVNAVPCDDFNTGVTKAKELAGENGVVCALGSLYFSGDVRQAYMNTK